MCTLTFDFNSEHVLQYQQIGDGRVETKQMLLGVLDIIHLS